CRDGAPDHRAFVDAGGLLAGPQPGGLHVDPGEPVRAAVERALLVAADPAGEAHLASGDQFRRVVEARAAGEETAISHVRYRAPAGGEAVGFDFHADRVAAGFHLDDATAPVHGRAGVVGLQRRVRVDPVEVTCMDVGRL